GRAAAGTLRESAALPRRPGLTGDLRYLATAIFGLRAARRELAALKTKQATRQQSRRHHLVTLGRTAVALGEALDPAGQASRAGEGGPGADEHPAMAPARTKLAEIDDERTKLAEQIAAAEAELADVRRARDTAAKQYASELAAVDKELAATADKLAPI